MIDIIKYGNQLKENAIKLQIQDLVLKGQMFMLNMSKHTKGKKKGQYKYIEMRPLSWKK